MDDGEPRQHESAEQKRMLWSGVRTNQGDFLIVLPEDVVAHWVERVPVLRCTTWGEVRKNVATRVYEEVLALSGHGDYRAYLEQLAASNGVDIADDAVQSPQVGKDESGIAPTDETPFDALKDIPFHETGDWPPSPQELMNRFLPKAVLDEYADTYTDNRHVAVSVLGWEDADAILTRLEQLGYEVVENARVAALAEDAAMG